MTVYTCAGCHEVIRGPVSTVAGFTRYALHLHPACLVSLWWGLHRHKPLAWGEAELWACGAPPPEVTGHEPWNRQRPPFLWTPTPGAGEVPPFEPLPPDAVFPAPRRSAWWTWAAIIALVEGLVAFAWWAVAR